ncbi:MAG: YkgJ family cysteine cluster protein [Parachlamydiaceae bacterium]
MNDSPEKKFQIPWYQKGLHFNCTQCGKCCTGAPGYIWASEEEILRMAEFLSLSPRDFKRLYMKKVEQRWTLIERKSQLHNCIFYQEKKCRIYAARPLQCRTYPFWQENLLSEANWKSTAKECEGIAPNAPLISSEMIDCFLDEERKQRPEEHYVSHLEN